MPTSTYSHINSVAGFLIETRPDSFLDVGLGNGKMGFIARDLLDVMLNEAYLKKDWKTRIDGIEVYGDYIQDHQKFIYDNIYIGNALEEIDRLGKYSMVYMGDVLEHFDKEDGWKMLDKCVEHSSAWFILSVPLGENWHQEEIYGNPHEEHKSAWHLEEVEKFAAKKEMLHFNGIGDYGTFLIKADTYRHLRARDLADAAFNEGRKDEAVKMLETALAGLPPDLASELVLVDLMLNSGKVKDAAARLERAAELFPNDMSVKDYLRQLKQLLPRG